ncbi:MAG: hypothetical protein Q8O51_01845 [bacterium]|nr:hypothetical protein [bacterium]
MPRQSAIRSRPYFQEFTALPHFEILVLRAALKPFHNSVQADGTLLGSYLERCFIRAQVELLEYCVKLDIGESILLSPPVLLTEVHDQCSALGFPDGAAAYDNAVRAARELPQIPARLYAYANIEAMSVPSLRSISAAYVRQDPRFPLPASEWGAALWNRYFVEFPGDAFRIPILVSVAWLACYAPEHIAPRARQLFRQFFDTTFHIEHVNWDEYDTMPGTSDPDDE